jgi:hypothetical protein
VEKEESVEFKLLPGTSRRLLADSLSSSEALLVNLESLDFGI